MTWLDLSIAADWVFLGAVLFGVGFAIYMGRSMARIERHLSQLKEAYWRDRNHVPWT